MESRASCLPQGSDPVIAHSADADVSLSDGDARGGQLARTGRVLTPQSVNMREVAFGRFLLTPVLGRITQAEAAEVAVMWVGEAVLPTSEAQRRAAEVLFLIRDRSSGTLAGVCTVYPAPLGGKGDRYWHFRMFMRPKFRGASGLPRFLLLASYAHLAHVVPSGHGSLRGVAVVAENPAFRRHRFREHFAKQNPPWRWLGANPRGHDIFYCDFPSLGAL